MTEKDLRNQSENEKKDIKEAEALDMQDLEQVSAGLDTPFIPKKNGNKP